MDGVFVPNISFGLPVIKSLRKVLPEDVIFDAHLMIQSPEKYIKQFADVGSNIFKFHYEAEFSSIENMSKKIRSHNMIPGLAINPKTKINDEILNSIRNGLIDVVMIMTVGKI